MLKSTYTPPPPLPPGWTEHKAPSGHTYYYNAQTKQSTYTRPQPLAIPSQLAAPAPVPVPVPIPTYTPDTLPPFSSTPYGPQGYSFGDSSLQHGQNRGGFRGGKGYRDRRDRGPEDRPKSKHSIPGCGPWVLVKTRLGRRFVHNPETQESFWKFPPEVMKGVVEYDRAEREARERRERGEEVEELEEPTIAKIDDTAASGEQSHVRDLASTTGAPEESDEYEEVEVTDSEEEDDNTSKRTKTEDGMDEQQPVEFTEEDIEYQLAAMGEDYGLDPGEYGEPGPEGWEEGAEGLPLTEEDATALFRDLLDDHHINPYSTWEKIIEEGHIIEDSRYTALPNMKARREVWSTWSRGRIQELREQKEKQEKQDPRIRYFAFLQEHATPKLYWPEFKRKFRRESEMKDTHLSDKDREKYYRDLVSRLKQPESSRKSDFSALLKSIPLQHLNRSTNLEALPSTIITDLRYTALPSKVRNSLLETYISTLPPPPKQEHLTAEELEELSRKKTEREKREKALAEREKRVQEDKRKQTSNLIRGKHLLREGEAEIEEAMRIRKEGLRSYLEAEQTSTHLRQEKGSETT